MQLLIQRIVKNIGQVLIWSGQVQIVMTGINTSTVN